MILFDRTFFRFVAVGLVNTATGYATIMLLYLVIGLSYSYAYFISYIIGIVISFFLNRKFVFFSQNSKIREFAKFLLSFAISYAVSYAALYMVVEYHLLDTKIAFFAGMVVYSTIFYLLNRFITFK